MSKRTQPDSLPRRIAPRQTRPQPKQVGMDQLSYFMGMVEHCLDPNLRQRFWDLIRENCPELMRGIDTAFTGEWQQVLFTRDLISPAFDPEILSDSPEEEQT